MKAHPIVKGALFALAVIAAYLVLVRDVSVGIKVAFVLTAAFLIMWLLGGTSSSRAEAIVDQKTIKNSRRLLLYATAVLSFLSLITTAKGMNGFVFERSWLAYLGSFGVQAVLVTLSLLLFRFFAVSSALDWPRYMKAFVKLGLIVFFCVFLSVSSIFSYVFIANYAYEDTYISDSDASIRVFLQKTAHALDLENEAVIDALTSRIAATSREKIDKAVTQADQEYSYNVKSLLPPETELQEKDYSVSLDLTALRRDYPDDPYLDTLESSYSGFERSFNSAQDDYNEYARRLRGLAAGGVMEQYDYRFLLSLDGYIETDVKALNSAIAGIENWRDRHFDASLNPQRTAFQNTANQLLADFERLRQKLPDIDESAARSGEGGSFDADDLLRQTYLLEIDSSVSVDGIIADITGLAVGADLGADAISDIVSLRGDLQSYSDCLELREDLNGFEDALIREYLAEAGAEQDGGEDADHGVGSGDTVFYVTEQRWRKARSQDLYELEKMVRKLPQINGLTVTRSEGQVPIQTDDIIETINRLKRNYLGELTDFERATGYLVSDYPQMALFSGFLALFFDLGTFFVGGFLSCADVFLRTETLGSKRR